jgi:hypothetical protein
MAKPSVSIADSGALVNRFSEGAFTGPQGLQFRAFWRNRPALLFPTVRDRVLGARPGFETELPKVFRAMLWERRFLFLRLL